MNSRATSVTALREIGRTAFWRFCNTICQEETSLIVLSAAGLSIVLVGVVNRATPSPCSQDPGPIPPIRQCTRDSLFPNGARESPEVDGVIAGALQLIANKFEVGHVGKSALRDPRSLA